MERDQEATQADLRRGHGSRARDRVGDLGLGDGSRRRGCTGHRPVVALRRGHRHDRDPDRGPRGWRWTRIRDRSGRGGRLLARPCDGQPGSDDLQGVQGQRDRRDGRSRPRRAAPLPRPRSTSTGSCPSSPPTVGPCPIPGQAPSDDQDEGPQTATIDVSSFSLLGIQVDADATALSSSQISDGRSLDAGDVDATVGGARSELRGRSRPRCGRCPEDRGREVRDRGRRDGHIDGWRVRCLHPARVRTGTLR